MITRLANFGGVGGQNSPYAPGNSPSFTGGPSGGGVNDFSSDAPLDDLMGRFRIPNVLGFERPLESLLENFHDTAEEDAAQYLLSPEERVQLKIRKKIRDKEEYLKSLSEAEIKKDDKNDRIKRKLDTMENLMEAFRKNTDLDFNKMANKKQSSFRRRPGTLPLLDEFLPTNEEFEDNELANARLTQPWTGPYDPQYDPSDGLDKYVEEVQNPERIDNHAYFTGLIDADQPTENDSHAGYGSLNPEPSPVTPESKNNNQALESKLEKLKKHPGNIGRLDQDMLYGLDWDEKLKGRYPQRGYTSDTPWGNDTLGGNSTSGYPDTSNNPYFGVIN